jgi:uncharacterized OsmC-like protein
LSIQINNQKMTNSEKIKTAFERNEQVLTKQPGLGQKTGKVSVHLKNGLCCEVESGPWKFRSDMSQKVGGTATAPSPGVYEAGALGSCIAIMAKMWAAKLDVTINDINVEVAFDTDMSMLFGVNDIPSHWKAIRYKVHVESNAPEADIRKVLDLAHDHSHVRGDLEHAFHIERTIEIVKQKVDTSLSGV